VVGGAVVSAGTVAVTSTGTVAVPGTAMTFGELASTAVPAAAVALVAARVVVGAVVCTGAASVRTHIVAGAVVVAWRALVANTAAPMDSTAMVQAIAGRPRRSVRSGRAPGPLMAVQPTAQG
jgi:hypothetical protein